MCDLTIPGRPRGYKLHQLRNEEACRECKDAMNEYHRVRRQTDKGAASVRANQMWSMYRVRPDDYGVMLAQQGGLCAICVQPFKGQQDMHLDHDHACSHPDKGWRSCRDCVRGILCMRCNTNIAILEDEEWLKRASRYLNGAVE